MFNLITILFLFFGPGEHISGQIEKFFKDALKEYDSFEVEMLSSPDDMVNVRLLADGFEKNKSIISLPAEVELKNGEQIKTYLSFRLKLFKEVLHSGAVIERNQELKPELFVLRKVEVSSINGTPVSSFSELNNTVSKKRISPGELLIKEMMERAPVITAGSKVIANVTYGSTVLSFDAVSRQNGSVDEIIRVITRDKKQYKAKVIDSVNVTIME